MLCGTAVLRLGNHRQAVVVRVLWSVWVTWWLCSTTFSHHGREASQKLGEKAQERHGWGVSVVTEGYGNGQVAGKIKSS